MLASPDLFLRRTKIVATLGPTTDTPEMLENILLAGVNVVRLNFSHGSHDDHQQRVDQVRLAAKKIGKTIGILADLQGPKIRVARFVAGSVNLTAGQPFILDAALDADLGNEQRVGIDYKDLPNDVNPEDTLLLDDGRLRLNVERVDRHAIHCTVLNSATLSNHKGINREGGGLNAKALTEKDKLDMQKAIELNVDYIAISFPRDSNDIDEARTLMQAHHGDAGIIAKIERTEAIDNLETIINTADGVMVARGDLAVEIGDAEVPLVQKEIIQMARTLNKPVIVATQMMESMITEPVPTRAEVSDVANAVIDNTDAVMLSAETATGQYPVETIKMVSQICMRVESHETLHISKHRVECEFNRIDEAIAMATMYTANHLKVAAIVCLTESGASTLWMSRIRTRMPIYGLSRSARSLGKMALYRGVYPFSFDLNEHSRDNLNRDAINAMQDQDLLSDGQRVILTKGDQHGVGGSNAMKILEVGNVL